MPKLVFMVAAGLSLVSFVSRLSAQGADAVPARFSQLTHDEAWQLLPQEQPALPSWALTLMRTLPRTTAAMLELDYLHRAQNPLGPALAAQLRWAVADAMQCNYGRRYAELDLTRAGWTDDDLRQMAAGSPQCSQADRTAAAFARALTLAGHAITDQQVANLLALFGAEQVVAIVHTVACANFQNRLRLALGTEIESGGPLPPVELRLDVEQHSQVPAPTRPVAETDHQLPVAAVAVTAPDWTSLSFTDLQTALNRQKNRKLRIPLPESSRLERLPAASQEAARKILWNTVSAGYQPLMTKTWFACRRAYKEEANPDQVFGNSVFWVVTRTNDCFY